MESSWLKLFTFHAKTFPNTCNICMGSNVGKDFDLGFSKKERGVCREQMLRV